AVKPRSASFGDWLGRTGVGLALNGEAGRLRIPPKNRLRGCGGGPPNVACSFRGARVTCQWRGRRWSGYEERSLYGLLAAGVSAGASGALRPSSDGRGG